MTRRVGASRTRGGSGDCHSPNGSWAQRWGDNIPAPANPPASLTELPLHGARCLVPTAQCIALFPHVPTVWSFLPIALRFSPLCGALALCSHGVELCPCCIGVSSPPCSALMLCPYYVKLCLHARSFLPLARSFAPIAFMFCPLCDALVLRLLRPH